MHLDQLAQKKAGKPDHVVKIASIRVYELPALALDAVGTRFVHRLACFHVAKDLCARKLAEFHYRGIGGGKRDTLVYYRNTREHKVLGARKKGEHTHSIFCILRLAERLVFIKDQSIRTDHKVIGGFSDSARLRFARGK